MTSRSEQLRELAERAVRRWRDNQLLRRFGGIQRCPWCRQVAQSGDNWHFEEWERDPFVDVLTCGVCGGTSLWRFEMGMMWIGPLEPPKPASKPAGFYDIEAAALRSQSTQEGAEQ